MQTFLLSLVIILLSVGGLAAGLFFKRPPLKASCGGFVCWKGFECAACTRDRLERRP